ncbi:hypothetical protein GBK02_15085 [Dechloromonas sp. TW-R-39-2]|uniref:hypothetical protein n=1 Tax=Dechloromonas sp. TW-R-39-2 TaxID=2654218 RepID=UPI00193E66AA|nr:hypothetical protein [Dechloromonas sp. TW-R-39-2]QRM20613.1 hypothetical protein GBK02_15085 [Dechloromonas sp. TW-R-39-2]
MKYHHPLPRKQSGIIIWLLVVLLILVSSQVISGLSESQNHAMRHQVKLLDSLKQAKEALIAYAVTDAKRPGRLPCPDITGTGISPILSRDDCDSYNGLLPWKTLDLVTAVDDRGMVFHYSLSRWFGGDRKIPPLNSDTEADLRVEPTNGPASTDIVAIIIASRGQLDPKNADNDLVFQSGTGREANNDDLLITITREELMAAVEKRIAGEAKSCLEQYASTRGYYPWPAPLGETAYRGSPGSLFGRVPETQPAGDTEMLVSADIAALETARLTADRAISTTERIVALKNLSTLVSDQNTQFLVPWANLAQSLAEKAGGITSALGAQSKAITAAIANDRISKTEKTNLRSSALAIKESASQLIIQLEDSGLDPLPFYLSKQNKVLRSETEKLISGTPSNLEYTAIIGLIQDLAETLKISHTGNLTLLHLLDTAYQAASVAQADYSHAQSTTGDTRIQQIARQSGSDLIVAVDALKTGISGQRINVHPEELQAPSLQLSSLPRLDSLLVEQKLGQLQKITASIKTESIAVLAQAHIVASSLESATQAIKATTNASQLQQTIAPALAEIDKLSSLIANNGDNIGQESLKAIAARYSDAENIFARIEPRTQQEMVPYVNALTNPADDLNRWAEHVHAQAYEISTWSQSGTDVIASINRKGEKLPDGSLIALQSYAKTTTEENRVIAENAQKLTAGALAVLKEKLSGLSASMAAAVPIRWSSNGCTMLNPESKGQWWGDNQWKQGVFYQISDRFRGKSGELKVNGEGHYSIVVLSSGPIAWHQVGSCQWQLQSASARISPGRKIADFLEKENSDPSRDGEAKNPGSNFVSRQTPRWREIDFQNYSSLHPECASEAGKPDAAAFPLPIFNDQLAY